MNPSPSAAKSSNLSDITAKYNNLLLENVQAAEKAKEEYEHREAAYAQLSAELEQHKQDIAASHDVSSLVEEINQALFLMEAEASLSGSMELYRRMVAAGIPAEDARYVTPQAVETNLILTMNARELRHFFKLRCCNRAQWEIRGVADAMLAICKRIAPELFYGAGPGCVRGNCPEALPCGKRRQETDWDVLPEQALKDNADRSH